MFCVLNAGQQIAVSCCFSLSPYTISCSLTVHLCVQCQLLWLGKRTCWRWSKWIWCTLDNASCSSFSFLFLWFFLFYCFFFVLVCPLSLSLYWFWSSVFFSSSSVFVCLCFFSNLFSNGESRGSWYTWRQSWCSCVGWPVISSLCFCFSFAYSPIFLPWVFFFSVLLFSCVCSSFLSPFVCIIHFLCSVCPLCVCPLFLFLFVLCLSSGSFLFSFLLFSFFVRASVMACIVGARRMLPWSAVVSAESGWRRWTVCFETAPFWAKAVILQFGH